MPWPGNRGSQRFLVRGLRNVKAVLLYALAHNLMRAVALCCGMQMVECSG